MCRCAERRAKIVDAAQALASGNVKAVATAATFVAATSAADVAQAAHLAAAKLRLRR